jgi:N-acetylmuramoyl-L-alanine amidase
LLGISAFIFAASPSPEEKEESETSANVMRIFIDPGHTKYTSRARGIIGEEYVVNYKVAVYLQEYLSADERFYSELSRDSEVYYSKIKQVVKDNRDVLEGIGRTKIPIDKRGGTLSFNDRVDMYAVRYYALINEFDYLLSIHFDYNWYKKNNDEKGGFHFVVSPYNRRFDESLAMVYCLKQSLAKEFPVSTFIEHNDNEIVPASIRERYHMYNLIMNGISVRSLILLGDAFEYYYYENEEKAFPYTEVPSAIVECGYVHEAKFTNAVELKKLALQMYRGFEQLYNEKCSTKELLR